VADPHPDGDRSRAASDGPDLEAVPDRAGPGILAVDFVHVDTVFLKRIYALIVNERHLRTVLSSYLRHYNQARPHRTLDQRSPADSHTSSPSVVDLTQRAVRREPAADGLINEYHLAAWPVSCLRKNALVRPSNRIFEPHRVQELRHELLDRTLIWNQRHLLRALREFEQHHNLHRPHQAMDQAAPLRPVPHPVTDPGGIARLDIRRHDRLGGIIHEYRRAS
jgi:hypothetical protein